VAREDLKSCRWNRIICKELRIELEVETRRKVAEAAKSDIADATAVPIASEADEGDVDPFPSTPNVVPVDRDGEIYCAHFGFDDSHVRSRRFNSANHQLRSYAEITSSDTNAADESGTAILDQSPMVQKLDWEKYKRGLDREPRAGIESKTEKKNHPQPRHLNNPNSNLFEGVPSCMWIH
jgi:hypothetical protein